MDGQNFQNNQDNTQDATPVNNYQDNTATVQNQVPPTAPEAPKQTNALAIVSLVLGILAIVLGCCTAWVGCLFGVAGVICAVFANKQGKTGLATAGLICSIVGIVLGILMTVLAIVFGAAMTAYIAEMGYNY